MKMILTITASLIFISKVAFANPGTLKEFNYTVSDISKMNLDAQNLFDKMQRSQMDLENSICANRAHVWAYDFWRFNKIKTGKIFVFFGSSIWREDNKGWMYHVAPYVMNKGNILIMEASYGDVTKPMNIDDWVFNETYGRVRGNECLVITKDDTDLTEYFYERRNLPEKRSGGKKGARCYLRLAPGHYTYPATLAYHDLKLDEQSKPIEFNPLDFDQDDILEACKNAFAGKKNPFFSGATAKCRDYLKLK